MSSMIADYWNYGTELSHDDDDDDDDNGDDDDEDDYDYWWRSREMVGIQEQGGILSLTHTHSR